MEGSGVVGPLVWCLYFGKFYSSALTMLLLADGTFDTLLQSFHAFYVTFNASPFGDCVDFWGVLRASFSSPSSDLFSVFCQFYIFWHGWCFFRCQSARRILDLLLSWQACCSCFDFKRDLLGQTWAWTVFLADAFICGDLTPEIVMVITKSALTVVVSFAEFAQHLRFVVWLYQRRQLTRAEDTGRSPCVAVCSMIKYELAVSSYLGNIMQSVRKCIKRTFSWVLFASCSLLPLLPTGVGPLIG